MPLLLLLLVRLLRLARLVLHDPFVAALWLVVVPWQVPRLAGLGRPLGQARWCCPQLVQGSPWLRMRIRAMNLSTCTTCAKRPLCRNCAVTVVPVLSVEVEALEVVAVVVVTLSVSSAS